MYMDDYKRWLDADLIDFDLKKELLDIEGDEDAIKDRFAVAHAGNDLTGKTTMRQTPRSCS